MMMDETQERFLRAIAEEIAPERIIELHLFSAIRQGANESRVAVIAAEPEASAEPEESAEAEAVESEEALDDAPAGEVEAASAETADDVAEQGTAETSQPPQSDPAPRRLTIYRAQYRLVLKGADRGTWNVNIAAEADAPIETVSDVVRGVRERAGEDLEPERFTGDAIRAVLASESWTGTR
ncbi:MAG TPA: hypothetical protein VF166_06605 [Gemmatimonadaceae bacterium]